jgi:LPS-assembly lipoprotein
MSLQKVIVITLTLLILGCGWQLRDATPLDSSIPSIYFSSSDEDNNLVRDLRRASNVYGVNSTTTQASSTFTVMVTDVREIVRIASINSGGRVAEYELTNDIDFVIISTDNNGIETKGTASATKVYEFDENDILASENEQQRVRYEMRKKIFRQILTQVQKVVIPSTTI